ncbi:SDR family NAD(P)-dependent oxidoreductase [Thermocatellispora tengchongensis]
MAEMRFDGKVAVVTGAGRGIGRAEALLLARRGAAVVVCDSGGTVDGRPTGEDPAGATADLIRSSGGTAVATRESVATEAGAQAIVAVALESFGRLDILLNNAGIFSTGDFETLPAEEFRAQIDVHYFGSLFMARAAWPHLKRSGAGRVVNTVSAALWGVPGMLHYGSAKGAVLGLTRNLAVAGHPLGIKVNALAPGAGTRMVDHNGDSLPPGFAEHMKASMPPGLVAPVAAYLAHESCEISGEVLAASGGSVARMVVVKTAGVRDPDLTPEVVRDRIGQIMDTTGAAVRELMARPSVPRGGGNDDE